MFNEMRRKKQQLSEVETIEILIKCTSGVLALAGDDGYPYAVPLSYAYKDGRVFFHCARTGYKLECLARNNRVSFCVIERDQVVSAEFTTYYRSAIVFGRARILTDDNEKKEALVNLLAKYSPAFMAERLTRIEQDVAGTCLVEITIDYMTGKAAEELIETKPASQP
jgi:uncharacterized protein